MSKKSLIIPLLAAAGLLFGIAGHLTGWQGNRPDQVTDDAYLKSQFALLPPDNATGNFTKVVQRVPVKIVFFRDSLISICPGLDSRQSSRFVPARREDDRMAINHRSGCQHTRWSPGTDNTPIAWGCRRAPWRTDCDMHASLDVPTRADAIRIALEQNQDLRAARQTLVRAQAGLAAAKDAYIPDVTALTSYSYQSGVPFLAHNFGTLGFSLRYDRFDGGRREAKVQEARSEVRSAEVAMDKLQSEIDIQVQAIYDRVDELRQMVDVAG